MALDKSAFESAILKALQTSSAAVDGTTNDPDSIQKQLAADLATAFDDYVRTIEVTVEVTGIAPTGTAGGPITEGTTVGTSTQVN